MAETKKLNLEDYQYHLPEELIAKYPLTDRAASKLLVYDQGRITHRTFRDIPDLLPKDALLVFNDTKVIPARLFFYKKTGGKIEIFLLEPVSPSGVYESAMNARETCVWNCMIGNARKWKPATTLILTLEGGIELTAHRNGPDIVAFHWNSEHTFSEILAMAGSIPLPPYLNRPATEEDKPRYQTVYSKTEGAVAAPTAGLHFTKDILHRLQELGLSTDYLTLHVSAGTFQPIKDADIEQHPMHREQLIVTRTNVENLLNNKNVIAVGTTSLRTMESLYWYGVKLAKGENDFMIGKLMPYGSDSPDMTREKSLKNILQYMDDHHLEKITGHTEIFIFPGYKFRICKGLVTNYHLPGSTLILLVAAMIGEDWREVYKEAVSKKYRFLSYGDASLLLPKVDDRL